METGSYIAPLAKLLHHFRLYFTPDNAMQILVRAIKAWYVLICRQAETNKGNTSDLVFLCA